MIRMEGIHDWGSKRKGVKGKLPGKEYRELWFHDKCLRTLKDIRRAAAELGYGSREYELLEINTWQAKRKQGGKQKEKSIAKNQISAILFLRGDGEIWTLAPVTRPTAFRVRTLQPLGYISKTVNIITVSRLTVKWYFENFARKILWFFGRIKYCDA